MSSKKLLSDVCYLALVAPSGECSQGESRAYLIGLLANTWCCLFPAAYPSVLNLVVVAVLRDSVYVGLVIAALRGRLLCVVCCILYASKDERL